MADEPQEWSLWEEGLSDVGCFMFLSEERVRFRELIESFANAPDFRLSEDRLRGVVAHSPTARPGHGHVTIAPDGEGDIDVDLSLHPGAVAGAEARLSPGEFVERLAHFVTPGEEPDELNATVFVTLSGERWKSTFQLPVSLPEAFGGMEGGPELVGLEFGFRDDSTATKRVGISRFQVGDGSELVVRISVAVPFLPAETVFGRLGDRITRTLALVAVPSDAELKG